MGPLTSTSTCGCLRPAPGSSAWTVRARSTAVCRSTLTGRRSLPGKPRSALDRTGSQTLDEPSLQRKEHDDERGGGKHGSRHRVPPVDRVLLLKEGEADRQRPHLVAVDDDEGPQEVVPRFEECEDRKGRHPGCRERKDDRAQDPELRGAVHARGFQDLVGDRGEEL